ncbi:transposase [Shuttleworthella satelles DSM 14600]|uniref:Transposase n=1 Tax=Shuttleworthella satelles DSM 14600 TaxID=626523 RepID=C4GE14_9FIRM|nr:transposase [Shuttleworthia satelles DSM 14600]
MKTENRRSALLGRKRYKRKDVSKEKTAALGIDDLFALKTSDDNHFYAVHERYFSDDKVACPACGSTKTRCSKVVKRNFKDILWDKPSGKDEEEKKFRVVDLTFYQRYLRCDGCNNSVFPEPIDFGDKGCRYTNRLSDDLADGTFRFSYKKVCDYYGVPASTASIGPIMRRRIQYRESLLLPVSTPQRLGIMEVVFFRESRPIVYALRDDGVYCLDILEDSPEETVLTFLRTLDTNEVDTVFIDPVESIRSAAATAFPGANIVVSDECLLRYARNAMLEIIHSDGKRFPVKFKDAALTMQDKHLQSDFERQQIKDGMESRPRLKSAYERHQAFMELLSGDWKTEDLEKWVDALPDDLPGFDPLVDVIDLFKQEISGYLELEEKPPDFYPTALQAVCEAFRGMPHCIFDVLRARCFLTIAYDTIEENGEKYRLGIHTTRLTQKMNEISNNIKEAREYGL